MRSGIVTSIKRHHHIKVANALYDQGYRYKNPRRKPTNIERLLEGLPQIVLLRILAQLEQTK